MITAAGSGEYIYAKDEKVDTDSESVSKDEKYVIIGGNGQKQALVRKIGNPEISGVVVVCEGGESSVVKEKVYNIAFKVYIISTLEQITSPVTVKLTNKTTGAMQTVTVTKSQMGFYITEAGEYTVEADLESVMVTPKAFKVTNDNLMTTQNITLREGSNMGYIGNYIGSFLSLIHISEPTRP